MSLRQQIIAEALRDSSRRVHVSRYGERFTTADRGPTFGGSALVALPWFNQALQKGR